MAVKPQRRRFPAALIIVAVLLLLSSCCCGVANLPTSVTQSIPGQPIDQVSESTSAPELAVESDAQRTSVESEREPTAEPGIELRPATVVRVIDGDTALFRLEDGTEERVRFIGIDTPESTNRVEPYGKAASSYTAAALPAGAKVHLEQDVEHRDRYGRLLAYVWLTPPSGDSEAEARDKMLNARIAADGYAQQMTIPPNVKYASLFGAMVAEARAAGRGLWSEPAPSAAPKPTPAPAPAPAPPKAQDPSKAGDSSTYIGNANTLKFHYASCGSVGQMNPSNKVAINSREQAISKGYVPCKRCNP